MKTQLIVMAISACLANSVLADEAPPLDMTNSKNQVSYASGVNQIRNFKKYNIPYDLEVMIRAMRDADEGKPLLLNDKDMNTVMQGIQADLRRAHASNRMELDIQNRRRGESFLVEYKSQAGVKTLPSGVLYKVIKTGAGKTPVDTDSVVVNYRGTKLDGTQFDATLPGKPATLRMAQTIKGWRDALKQMPVGSKWEIAVPAALAYADRGAGEIIGPNETLKFEVELVGIKGE